MPPRGKPPFIAGLPEHPDLMRYNKRMREASFSDRAKQAITGIPYGKVATYGQIAACAGNHRAARQVAWLLHSSSRKDNLPWHRVINSREIILLLNEIQDMD